MSENTQDNRHAKQLGTHPGQVSQTRDRFNTEEIGRIMRHVLVDRCEQQIEERRTKLESVSPEDLKKVQGEISGIRIAIAAINQK